MKNILDELELDINRCRLLIKENNYLEIVIAIEELHDKYKNNIKEIANTNSNIVWNYRKRDIENIEKYLINYKEELLLKEKYITIDEKIKNLKSNIKNSDMLDKKELIDIIESIDSIRNDENIDADKKWDRLKNCLDIIKKQEREVSLYLLDIITLLIR